MEWFPHRDGSEDGLLAWRWMRTRYDHPYRIGIDHDDSAEGGPWQLIHAWGFDADAVTHVVESVHATVEDATDAANALIGARLAQGYAAPPGGHFAPEDVTAPDPGAALYETDPRRWREAGPMPSRISMDADGMTVWITAITVSEGGALVVIQSHADAMHPQTTPPRIATLDADEAVAAANRLLAEVPDDPARPLHQDQPFARDELLDAARVWMVELPDQAPSPSTLTDELF